MWLLADYDLATGEGLPIDAPELKANKQNLRMLILDQHLSSPLGRHHHAFGLADCPLLGSAFTQSHYSLN